MFVFLKKTLHRRVSSALALLAMSSCLISCTGAGGTAAFVSTPSTTIAMLPQSLRAFEATARLHPSSSIPESGQKLSSDIGVSVTVEFARRTLLGRKIASTVQNNYKIISVSRSKVTSGAQRRTLDIGGSCYYLVTIDTYSAASQISGLRVREIDAEGQLELRISKHSARLTDEKLGSRRFIGEATGTDDDGILVSFMLHVEHGALRLLEMLKYAPHSVLIQKEPDLDSLRWIDPMCCD